MCEPSKSLEQQLSEALALIARQQAELDALRKLVEELRGQLERGGGQVAPFRREPRLRKQSPKGPGRECGHPAAHRPVPTSEPDEKLEAAQPTACPHCGGTELHGFEAVDEFVEDLPPPKAWLVRMRSWKACCTACGATVVSAHESSPSGGRPGAVSVRIGPRARAAAAVMTRTGLSTRKTCDVLGEVCGLKVSPGAVAQSNHRLACTLEPQYAAMLAEIRRSPVVHVDETGWWMAGQPRTLHVTCTPTLTLFNVEATRTRAMVRERLGKNFAGVLVSDCLSIYDDVNNLQQKCYAHHLRAIDKAKLQAPASVLLRELHALLLGALEVRERPVGEERQRRRAELKTKAGKLLFQTARGHPAEKKIVRRLQKQRDHLFTFLDHPGVDATNNLAERQLRPAVISRKISAGNKTDRGARTWQVLTSIHATARQRGTSCLDALNPALQAQSRR